MRSTLTSLRHKLALEEAEVSLKLVRKSIRDGMSEDLYTIDLMNAYSALGKILGEQWKMTSLKKFSAASAWESSIIIHEKRSHAAIFEKDKSNGNIDKN
jgi:hypothetical protein